MTANDIPTSKRLALGIVCTRSLHCEYVLCTCMPVAHVQGSNLRAVCFGEIHLLVPGDPQQVCTRAEGL